MNLFPRSSRAARALALAVLLLSALPACAGPARLFVNPQADMTLYKKIVVAPFANLSGDPYAGARLTRAFTTEIVITDRFQLVDPALLLGELQQAGVQADAQGQIDIVRLREAATKLEVTGLIRGAVTEYTLRRVGNDEYPVVSFDAEMVDAPTGNIVWRISVTETGKGRLPVIGGSGERSFARVTEAACQHALRALRKRAF